MNLVFLNVLFMLGWCLVTGSFSGLNLAWGYVVGFAGLWITSPLYGETGYFTKTNRVIQLMGFFLVELVKSSIRVAWDVITPDTTSRPGIIAVPLDVETDVEIMLLANMISLTPGTLSLEVSDDRRTLYVHAMFIDDLDALKQEIKDGMEARILEASR